MKELMKNEKSAITRHAIYANDRYRVSNGFRISRNSLTSVYALVLMNYMMISCGGDRIIGRDRDARRRVITLIVKTSESHWTSTTNWLIFLFHQCTSCFDPIFKYFSGSTPLKLLQTTRKKYITTSMYIHIKIYFYDIVLLLNTSWTSWEMDMTVPSTRRKNLASLPQYSTESVCRCFSIRDIVSAATSRVICLIL